jgi:hypothetical protein
MGATVPLVTVHALTRSGSDHTPLLIASESRAHLGKHTCFSFELSWLREEGFYGMVTTKWPDVSYGDTPIERWQNKITFSPIS